MSRGKMEMGREKVMIAHLVSASVTETTWTFKDRGCHGNRFFFFFSADWQVVSLCFSRRLTIAADRDVILEKRKRCWPSAATSGDIASAVAVLSRCGPPRIVTATLRACALIEFEERSPQGLFKITLCTRRRCDTLQTVTGKKKKKERER